MNTTAAEIVNDDDQSNASIEESGDESGSDSEIEDSSSEMLNDDDDQSVQSDESEVDDLELDLEIPDTEVFNPEPVAGKKPRGRPRRAAKSTAAVAAENPAQLAISDATGIDEDIYNKIRNRIINVEDDDSSDDEMVPDSSAFQKLSDTAYAEKTARLFSVRERPLKEELNALLVIHRDANGLIRDPKHTTIPILTMYEKARVLSERVQQLDVGAEPLVPVDPDFRYNNYAIAVKELEYKKLPFIVQRPLPDNTCEYWRLTDLQLIS